MGWGFHTKINGDGSSHNTVYDRDTNERHSWDNDGKGNITKDHHTDQNTDKKTEYEDSYSPNNKGAGNNSYSI